MAEGRLPEQQWVGEPLSDQTLSRFMENRLFPFTLCQNCSAGQALEAICKNLMNTDRDMRTQYYHELIISFGLNVEAVE